MELPKSYASAAALIKTLQDAVSSNRCKEDDIALPTFDPEKINRGAAAWCSEIKALADELRWSSISTVARAGKALRGSALQWFESWEPEEGRTWKNFCADFTYIYPDEKDLADRLSREVLYTFSSADSYCEYAKEKIRLLRNTKVGFTEEQIVELVCGYVTMLM